jgi:hypothetical protein
LSVTHGKTQLQGNSEYLKLFNFYTGAEQQPDSAPISCDEESSALPDCATAVGHEYLKLFWSEISGKAKFPTFIMISKPNCAKIVNILNFFIPVLNSSWIRPLYLTMRSRVLYQTAPLPLAMNISTCFGQKFQEK